MFNTLSNYLKQKADFAPADLEAVKQVCTYRELAANEKLLTEGELWQHNAFVCRGLTRGYITNLYGVSQTINFSPEEYWTGDRESLLTGKPTHVNVEALVATSVIMIHKDDFHNLCISVAPFGEFTNTLIQKNLTAYQKRMEENRAFTIEEKVAAFVAKFPTVPQRASLHTIATYLDISEETLKQLLP